ncbi:MAG: site-specific integrase, partial [Erythrobacter sp.]|nr:site-specific integrase [Erythrobacter sp.]
MTGRPAVPKKKRATRDGVPLVDFSEKLLAIPGSTHDLIKRYLDHITIQHYSAQTIRRYRSDLLQWAAFCEERGLTQSNAITRQHLERFQASLFRYRKANGDALSLRTQKMRLVVVRNFFSWAVKKHFLPANPAADLDLPRPAQVLPVSLTPDEVRRVLAAPDPEDLTGLRNRALLETLYSTGIRRAEVTRLEVDDIEAST